MPIYLRFFPTFGLFDCVNYIENIYGDVISYVDNVIDDAVKRILYIISNNSKICKNGTFYKNGTFLSVII